MRTVNSFESHKFHFLLSFHVSYNLTYSMGTSFTLHFHLQPCFHPLESLQSLILGWNILIAQGNDFDHWFKPPSDS